MTRPDTTIYQIHERGYSNCGSSWGEYIYIYICGKYFSEHQDEAKLSALAVSFNLKSVKVLTPMM